MFSFLASVFSGGVTGLLGVATQRFFDFLKVKQEIQIKKLEFENAREMRKLDMEMLDKEWAHRARISEIEAQGVVDAADAKAFSESFYEPKMYSEKVKPTVVQGYILIALDLIRGIVRPGLTVYLCVLTTLIYLEAKVILAGVEAISTAQAISIHDLIVSTILYLTTTCVLWWFGTRNKQKPPGVK